MGLVHHSLDRYTIMAKAERRQFFYSTSSFFFTLKPTEKKKLMAQPGIEPGPLICNAILLLVDVKLANTRFHQRLLI